MNSLSYYYLVATVLVLMALMQPSHQMSASQEEDQVKRTSHNIMRFGRTAGHNIMRFGRAGHNIMHFGKRAGAEGDSNDAYGVYGGMYPVPVIPDATGDSEQVPASLSAYPLYVKRDPKSIMSRLLTPHIYLTSYHPDNNGRISGPNGVMIDPTNLDLLSSSPHVLSTLTTSNAQSLGLIGHSDDPSSSLYNKKAENRDRDNVFLHFG